MQTLELEKPRPLAVKLDPDQVEDLDEVARVRRASRSQIMREAVDFYLDANGGPRRRARIEAEQAVSA